MNDKQNAPRNLFEFDNAKYLSREEMVTTFLATKSFWRLLTPKNHVVLGARGSGKTAIAKMLAHPQLSRFSDNSAQKLVRDRSYIGVYLATTTEWVGALRNKPWLDEAEKEDLFRWRLNLSACLGVLETIGSCLECYLSTDVERIRAETVLANRLSADWLGGGESSGAIDSFRGIADALDDLDYMKQCAYAVRRARRSSDDLVMIGGAFHTEPFVPLRRAIRHCTEILDLPETATWMICIDEAETLEPFHQRILNSSLRTKTGNLVFKITTTPYGHYTLETNVGDGLSVGNDFDYVYIDRDFQGGAAARGHKPTYESQIFKRRAKSSTSKLRFVSMIDLLGPSPLLTPLEAGKISREEVIKTIRAEGTPQLIDRTLKLEGDSAKQGNEIVRKVAGAVVLRDAVRKFTGQSELELYTGAAMVARCSDGNPRRLIRLFNKLLTDGRWTTVSKNGEIRASRISARQQSQILRDFSINSLVRVQPEPRHGRQVYRLLLRIARYMRRALHDEPLSTDQITSLTIDETRFPIEWPTIKAAVGLGLLYPNVHPKNPDEMPEGGGTFHLAYVLAPAFNLLPRRGKARQLSTMLAPEGANGWIEDQPELSFGPSKLGEGEQ